MDTPITHQTISPQYDDGYVKYKATRLEEPLPKIDLFEELNKTRSTLHRLKLIGIYPNGIGFGNISIRYQDEASESAGENSFIISGTATGESEVLTPDQYTLVKSCDPQHNTVYTAGMIDASSESMSHGMIYSTLPQVHAAIHIHSRKLFDFMIKNDYPKTPKEIPYGTPEMAYAIAEQIKKDNSTQGLFVMAGHDEGIMAYGEDLKMAYQLIEKLYKTFGEPKMKKITIEKRGVER